ncbi:uncharacterized protein LOC112452272 isoform X1 [Temnothorax curvispinosus]|uniref:Uncharacterized protein LOC112452272 isoform X1 n=1 Tax=Temnothorax curvispinosus TaxID=300111 RepID=A0A6J1PFX0_9HYME|nr:uncharacterized protein LOC112452272 isoform X1 [Temnothorax curvispinosus]
MESEARNQINNDYNKFFYATMCHVCKRIGDGVPLKLCSNCKMISYCGQEHQKQHWKQHKPLCKAIQNVLQGRQGYNMNVRGETSEEWINIKQMFMLLVSRVLKRRLTMCEMQMFKFPRECLICHERNAQSLKVCQKCATCFCIKDHEDGIEHRNICASLELCFRSDLLATKEDRTNSCVPDMISYAKHVFDTNIEFLDMNDFIDAYGVIRDDSDPDGALAADHSQYLTRPLTLFCAMRLLHYSPRSNKDFVVHVVGASRAEECTLIGWEVLSCLLEIVMSVTIVMIGPELKYKYTSNACDPCTSSDNKSLFLSTTMRYTTTMYAARHS